jgi:outer membrane protein assembly factor BamB
MKYRTLLLIAFFLIGGMLLSSCQGAIGTASWPGLSTDEDTLYLSYGPKIYSIRISDGTLIWGFPSETKNTIQFYAPAYPADGQLIVGDFANRLYSIDHQNGSQQWTFDQAKGRWIASVTVVDDIILAPSADNSLYALNLQGQIQWQFEGSSEPLWAQPVANGSLVYQGSMDHTLYAINLTSGTEAWNLELDGAIVYAPLLSDGVLYVVTLADTVYAIDTTSRRILWQFKTDEEVWGVPALHDGTLYFADLKGQIYAVATESGQQAWKMEAGGPVVGSIGLTPDGFVVITETGDVLLVSFEGTKQWTRSIEGKLYGVPAIGDDRIVVPVVEGEQLLVAYDFRGNQVWTFVPPK